MDISIDRILHISFPDSVLSSLHDITTGIEVGTASVSEIIISDGGILFGAYASNKFEIQMYDISDVAGEKIVVWFEDSSHNRTDVFTGYVDSCKLDNLGYYRQIVAYDRLYWSKDADVSTWWNNFWTTNTSAISLVTLRNSLCDYIGLTYSSAACFNDSLSIKPKETGISGLKFSQMLSIICELQCTFPNIDRDGRLKFISLDPAKVTTHNIIDEYEQGESEFEEFQTAVIDRIEVTLDNELVYRTSTSGSNIYTVDNNMLLYDYTTNEIQSFADAYLVEASKITYTPASIELIVSDFSIVLGDIVTTDNGNVYVLANDYYGSLLVDQRVTATGDKYLSGTSSDYSVTYDSLSTKIADTVVDLHTNYVRTTMLDADVATLGYLKTANLDAEVANVGYLKVADLDADVATLGYLKTATADITYAQIDLANVNNAWITNGIIKNGAIVDAQIGNVSANKLTAGTLDASNINVINLNASNITTGSLTVGGLTVNVTQDTATLDGSSIENGTITMSGLSQEVVDMIDGAIETFTATAVPTLNNYPASDWTTAEERHSHIGDICYVVNSALTEDGYCYRFTYNNVAQTYSWILIKDSDVTKALQDIITIEGDITGLQSFESTTSSWMTQTDSTLSSLQTRTTSLETAMGTKVDISTFNTLSQEVDTNTANITSLTTTVSTKADQSTVTTLSNTVNTLSQTVNTNTSNISSLTTTTETLIDEVSGQANTIETTSVQVSTLQQTLSSFQTSVSETYATTSELESQISIVNSALTQTSSSLIADFSSLSQTVDNLTGDVSDAIAISKSIGFVDGDLVLYRSDSPNNVRLTTDELQFNYDTETVAKIYQNEGISLLEITNAEIKTTLTIGNFEFVPRASGNLSFRRRS